jgi:hypothetical protein
MKQLGIRILVMVGLPLLLIAWFVMRLAVGRSPVHPVRAAKGSASQARGSYQDFRSFLDDQKRVAHRSWGSELADDALSALLRGKPRA